MRLSAKQVSILENIDRVSTRLTTHGTRAYELDGSDCRRQVASLIVKGFLKRTRTGRLAPTEGNPVQQHLG